ncbi:flagellar assembly protein FliW [Sporosarcina psychrophila]|uniref:flagellar assembly protein FliW n=1 Tax=Sporosarcina psychrophila TaxID=1476 RepID=UPI00078BD7DB|nr:flagellar assembly protein FliW [Sporosarcina psychrophila]AMQ07540.1 flagellar assembly protein FliW [Sporosarcina psychrophila]
MKIQSTILGEVEALESEILTFDNGLPGFENEKNFILLSIEGNEVYQILQSINSKEVGFVTANPYLFISDYTFDLDESTVEALNIESEEDIIILTIVTVKEPFNASTVNLKAPVIINTKSRIAKQCILEKTDYPIRYAIDAQMQKDKG